MAVSQLDEENMRDTDILGPANQTWKGPRGYSCNTTREQRERDQRGPKLVTERDCRQSEQPCGFWEPSPGPSRHNETDLVKPVPDHGLVWPASFAHLQERRAHCLQNWAPGGLCGDLIVRAAASVLCPSAPDDRAGALGAMAPSELSTDCLAHAGPPAPSNQSRFQLCPRDCSSKGCPKLHPRVQPARG